MSERDLMATGRRTILSALREVQAEGRKIFIAFLTGFILSIVGLRLFAWTFFESVMRSEMTEELGDQVNIIARNPFEVLLVQAKISMIVGIAFTIPILIYIAKRRFIPSNNENSIPVYAYVLTIVSGTALFIAGLWYSYFVFFPVIFQFLASATVQTGVQPMYSIAKWTQFMILLSLSFGLLSQIPVSIPTLVRYEIVSYSTIKDGFRYWILGTLCVGAVLSPPEPISQLMWSGPLIGLYVLAVFISKYINPSRNSDDDPEIDEYSEENELEGGTDNHSDSSENSSNTDGFNLSPDGVETNYDKMIKIGGSLRNNGLLLASIFMITGAVSFYAQFSGATEASIELITGSVSGVGDLEIVALHPVELLMFQAKMSMIVALIPTVIVGAWKIWPDIRQDNIVHIGRTNMISYALVPIISLSIGCVIGLLVVSPEILEFLISDANRINAEISYRISSFFWIVMYTTIITGMFISIYTTMVYWYARGVDESLLTGYWRQVVFGVLIFSMFITPDSISKSLAFMFFPTISFLLGIVTIQTIERIRS